jgi:anti-sigma factor RsiW
MSHLGERLSALIDGELSHDQRDRVLAHLAKCEPCRREAAALRLLKRRMRTLGEATAGTGLTDRLMAMAGPPGGGLPRSLPARGEPGSESTTRFPVRSLALGALVFLALGLPAAAFVAGGTRAEPGPSVTPAIEMYATQHAITTGAMPAATPGEAPATGEPGTGERGTGAPSGGGTAGAPATGPGQAGADARLLQSANASQTMKRDMNGVANVSRPPGRRDQTAPRTHRGSRRPAVRRLVAAPRGG